MPKPRNMLSDWDAPYIQALVRLIETQSKTTLAYWALDYADRFVLPIWLAYDPEDMRPQQALSAARLWLAGDIKLPQAKPAILACHEAARAAEGYPAAQAAARAIGQCSSTIHSARHCIGLAAYGAIAIAYDHLGADTPWRSVEPYAAEVCGQMLAALQAVAVDSEPEPAKINWNC